MNLKEITDEIFFNLDVGDMFLYGESVIKQKTSKNIGDSITYYIITEKRDSSNNSVCYEAFIEKLEG
jgi:hypothetical protein